MDVGAAQVLATGQPAGAKIGLRSPGSAACMSPPLGRLLAPNWPAPVTWHSDSIELKKRTPRNCSQHVSHQSFSAQKEAQFKFPKLTLDGVRLSREEVRPERKSKGQASHSPVAERCPCFPSSRNDSVNILSFCFAC
eukprot:XP_028342092.1 transmembrane protein 273 isoform X2 [Physeter catodon]